MIGLSLRARLTVWASAIVGLCLIGFSVAAYSFLGRVELMKIDRMMDEQSEIVTDAVVAGGRAPLDASRAAPAVLSALRDLRTRSVRIGVFDARGRELLSTDLVREGEGEAEEREVLGPPLDLESIASAVVSRQEGRPELSVAGPLGGFRVHVDTFTVAGAPYFQLTAISLRDVRMVLTRARTAALVAFPVALLVAGLGGSLLARRGLAPVAEMIAHASRISTANIHERLPVSHAGDELGQLATTFNATLDRLDQGFAQQRQFMADVSHELRTPVAIVRGEADIALSLDARPPEEYRDALGVVRSAAERMTRTLDDLLLLARADAGQAPMREIPLYLDDLVRECARAVRSLGQQRGIAVHVSVPEDVAYIGDEELLRRLLVNLLDNAIKYSGPGADVGIRLASEEAGYRVSVSDTGPGIPPEAQSRVFDRFFRADRARSRSGGETGGTGLGLSIARWIAEVHGGHLRLAGSSAAGTTFELWLPRRELQPQAGT